MVDALLVEEELEVALDKGQRPQNELDLPQRGDGGNIFWKVDIRVFRYIP